MKTPIYLDYKATTPEVVEAIRPFLVEHFGNLSSSHDSFCARHYL
jgi:cysteine sulfinate desulfinase/cysteine desulfurase-like protein